MMERALALGAVVSLILGVGLVLGDDPPPQEAAPGFDPPAAPPAPAPEPQPAPPPEPGPAPPVEPSPAEPTPQPPPREPQGRGLLGGLLGGGNGPPGRARG